ncbi:hypothetical protein NDU88_004072 [Pleurodeles waltl]|uniref:Uncharacterized protein n=1 Tax=Pleurodeles waltl TaxID=8319 RepID=A0AAV7KYU6_PLEWA|nr:hypothetical protein NDU88_004072 [Pleurodeles waltl]
MSQEGRRRCPDSRWPATERRGEGVLLVQSCAEQIASVVATYQREDHAGTGISRGGESSNRRVVHLMQVLSTSAPLKTVIRGVCIAKQADVLFGSRGNLQRIEAEIHAMKLQLFTDKQ